MSVPSAPPPSALNLRHWIDTHRELLRPPVGNKVIYGDGEFIVMAVGGPNARTDFHVDPAEELFYQLEGDITLRVREHERIVDIPIRAGEMLLLPAGIPHSPQRPAGTVGIVVERRRRAGELDGVQWYCAHCGRLLHEQFLALNDIERQLTPIFEHFFASVALRTCRHCHTVMEPPSAPSAPSTPSAPSAPPAGGTHVGGAAAAHRGPSAGTHGAS
jgi:3-hydroxyanthranilate 3,4-dioxygenase